ncbi:stress-induced protein [Duganella sp. FT50W]|uniref:Stress-induced protein n=1 Tax=Duganella lactea TaxID=2692173 RepID=A0A6L8MSD9_9BURK|nr:KGG domain-containing protein [Duganella lactea]MYM84924.1 stress-induced protein [Duganella lactea]
MANANQGNQGGNQGGKNQQSDTSNRGFASMDPERQREIAAEGGRAAHASGNAHEFSSEEARRAGAMSHKNDANQQSEGGAGGAGGARSSGGGNQQSGGTRGGTPEQHAEAGRQSPKKDR